MKLKVGVVFGTRPEAIKMAPIVQQMRKDSQFECIAISTGQHRQMLDPILEVFQISTQVDLEVMRPNQTLAGLTSSILEKADAYLSQNKLDLLLVHGDTTTSMAMSLAAFYHKIPVGHVEAGLRTHDLYSPWPEEMNRQVNSVIAQYHFVPTQQAKLNLLKEDISEKKIFVTGNTVTDALLWAQSRINSEVDLAKSLEKKFSFLDPKKKLILVTGHRRENFGNGFQEICRALAQLSDINDVQVVYPVHLNPNVKKPVYEMLSGKSNIHLIEPQDYLDFVYLMTRSYLILTDSGGVQEEAPSLGKPVLVMREVTERPEAIAAGTVRLVGAECDRIIAGVKALLEDQSSYLQMSKAHNPYGDGKATERILAALKAQFSTHSSHS